MKKRFAITVLALALTAGSAMTSFAAGFTGTGKGVKYQWGMELIAPITGYSIKITGFTLAMTS